MSAVSYAVLMTHDEAEHMAKRLMEEHETGRYAWLPKEAHDGSWSVVKAQLPEHLRRTPAKATIEAKPKPPQADDPRPAMWRDVGGPYAGG